MIKDRLGSDQSTKQKLGPIKFVKECNLLELLDDIDKDLWVDDTIPLEFIFLNSDDDIFEYLGAHSKLPKSNERR